VSNTGGLADSVVHASAEMLKNGTATGFVVQNLSSIGLLSSITEAITLRNNTKVLRALQKNGMSKNLSWETSAALYLKAYSTIA
jgi:starch synthase